MKTSIPDIFRLPYQKIAQLKNQERYIGAFIFGSLARGDATSKSDFDVKVIVNEENSCSNINHPIIDGIKLDLTFISLNQLKTQTLEEINKAERIPLLAESHIIFDKSGEINRLRKKAQKAKPARYKKKDYQLVQFMIYHADDKAKRYLGEDEHVALVAMEINLDDILKYHYKLNGKWWVSNKRILQDLRKWDPKLSKLVELFVKENKTQKKYDIWVEIIDHIALPMGGRQPIAENNCKCTICKKDLELLFRV